MLNVGLVFLHTQEDQAIRSSDPARPALRHMVQEWLAGAAADPAPGDQAGGDTHPAAGVMIMKPNTAAR